MKFNVFCTENVKSDPQLSSILDDHKRVCDHLGIEVEYHFKPFVAYDQAAYDHGHMITDIIKNNDGVSCFMDLDCLPWNRNILQAAYDWCVESRSFIGNAQNVSHTSMREYVYAAPSMMMVHRDAWEYLGSPSMAVVQQNPDYNNEYVDTAQQLSLNALQKNFNFQVLWPLGVDKPQWVLKEGVFTGTGTKYPGSYHYFKGATEIGQDLDLWKSRVDDILNDREIISGHRNEKA